MRVFEVVIALLLCGAAFAAIARRIGAPYPALLALTGAALALIPGLPTLVLDPELALTLFVAPVLVDAAFDASQRDLRRNWRPIVSLAIGAVVLTIVVVAVVARELVPDMPWPVAIALGAIVAPPDATAATAAMKQLRPPHRILVILEGESLFNDASALIIYRIAVGAAISGMISGWLVVPTFLFVIVGSAALGLALSKVMLAITKRITDVATSVVVPFCGTFAVWILAERLHLSGIITLVVFAMATSRRAPEIMPARIRIPAWAVWEVAVFVLNVLAFILVGFELKLIGSRLTGAASTFYITVAAAVCAACIVTRIVWVTGATTYSRWRFRPRADGKAVPKGVALNPRRAAVVAWCGMRGTVTIAAALALPMSTDGFAFPYRDLIIVTAFGVVLGTLVLQGLTLRPLMMRLHLEEDETVGLEVHVARVQTLRAAADAAAASAEAEATELVRQRYDLQLRRAEQELYATEPGAEESRDADAAVVNAATQAARQRLVALRTNHTIGDAAFQRVQEELDWAELDWEQFLRRTEED